MRWCVACGCNGRGALSHDGRGDGVATLLLLSSSSQRPPCHTRRQPTPGGGGGGGARCDVLHTHYSCMSQCSTSGVCDVTSRPLAAFWLPPCWWSIPPSWRSVSPSWRSVPPSWRCVPPSWRCVPTRSRHWIPGTRRGWLSPHWSWLPAHWCPAFCLPSWRWWIPTLWSRYEALCLHSPSPLN